MPTREQVRAALQRERSYDGSHRIEAPTKDDRVLDWIKQRARSDDPLQRAAAARTPDPPTPDERSDDVTDVLTREHNKIAYLSEQLQTVPGASKGGSAAHLALRTQIIDMMRERITRHEAAEATYFWPAVREHLPGGTRLADTAHEQEQHGAGLLHQLKDLGADEVRFDELAEQLIAALHKHVAFEDSVLLGVREHLPAELRDRLGRQIRQAQS
jgi:hemerythrin-like domain-containing protein